MQTSILDSRYPRPQWLRLLRLLALHWWLFAMTILSVSILTILILTIANGENIVRIFLGLIKNLDVSIPFVLLLVITIPTGILARRWAKKDERQEKLYTNETYWEESEEDKRQRQEARKQSREREKQPPPTGFKLRCVLSGFSSAVNSIVWSPNGRYLASSSGARSSPSWYSVVDRIRVWDVETGQELQTFSGYSNTVSSVAWSPNGRYLASGSSADLGFREDTLKVWDVETGQELQTFLGYSNTVSSVAWSPDGRYLASGSSTSAESSSEWRSETNTLKVWDVQTGQELQTFSGHSNIVSSVAWSPDGRYLASGSSADAESSGWGSGKTSTLKVWDVQTGQELQTFSGHNNIVSSVAWSPDGQKLVFGSSNGTIQICDISTWDQSRVLEGHTNEIASIAFSFDGRFLVSKSSDETVRLRRTDTWEPVAILNETVDNSLFRNLALGGSMFSPNAPVLATLGEEDTVIRIWDLDFDALLNASSTIISNSYTNAKVVLLGDSGVGKSGLGLVLSGQPFTVTESTHARRVWTFEQQEAKLSETSKETRETLLWDLAGQPSYRLIHQLYLNEVAVALVVFDAHSETDPFAGVEHWHRALLQAQRVQGNAALPLKKFLVAARIDRGGIGVSHERIQAVVDEFGFDGYFATSAREGWQIDKLKEVISGAINWEKMLPKVTSTALFQQIKSFLIEEKKHTIGLISTVEDLYRTFVRSEDAPMETEELTAQFETCIGRVEASGLIKRLSFGRLVLLQPEMLDAYASALVSVVKDEPDGLGHIAEERVRDGNFRMPADERIKDQHQEELLLLAMVEDLLRRELALREESYLVFPSQSTKENPDLPNPEGKTLVFDFEGPVLNIYATLAVRLANSGVFKKKSLWKNAIIYMANGGGECGMFLHNIGEGRGDLTLFYPHRPGRDICNVFEEFVHLHLKRRALPDNFKVRRIIICRTCNTIIPDDMVQRRKGRGIDWLNCPVCDTHVSLTEQDEPLRGTPSTGVQKMDQAADAQRDIQVNKTSVEGKKGVQDFDVFLCHHSIDKSAVKKIGEQLQERGLLPWLDEWELRPGLPWQRILEEQIGQIKCAAVFVGKNGIGPWQQLELEGFLREFVQRGCPVIPVLLEDAPLEPKLPIFLQGMTWVDFRKQEPNAMDMLEWGITGKRKGR